MTYRTQDADMKAAQFEEALGKIEVRTTNLENVFASEIPTKGLLVFTFVAACMAFAALALWSWNGHPEPPHAPEKKSCHDSALRLTGEDAPKFERCEEGATVKVETLGTFIVAICTCSTGSADAGVR